MLQNIKNYVKGFHGKTRNKVQNYFNRNWKETDTPVYWGTLAALCLLAGDSARELFPNPALGFVCGAALMFFGGTICFKFLNWLLERLRRVKSRQMISILALLIVSGGLGISGNLGNAAAEGLLFGIIFALALIWFIKSLWACFHNRVHTPTVFLTGCVSGCIFLSGCAFLAWDGFEDTYIEEYLALNEEFLSEREIEGFDRELQEGIYTVEALEYGTGKDVDVESETVDLSFCAQNPDGITGLWREAVSGYDVAKAPIAGKVWYPLELSDCPVLFFAHGNHGILTKSYLGYAYLGEYLASHGYVVVSVDENVLNMLSNENDARAILLLENMKKVQEFNRSEGNPLYGKMDYDNIVIGGHSPGRRNGIDRLSV